MTAFSRRRFIVAASAPFAVAACGNGVGSTGGGRIDARVDEATNFMYDTLPETQTLASKSAGVLMMPLITEAGFGIGGGFGRGALRIDNVTVDYYSSTNASIGLQIGAQQYAHALFFMTPASLNSFRSSPGWVAGADLEYAVSSNSGALTTDTTSLLTPVVAVVFGQAGLIAGATVEGQKYNRIIP
ncbi:twin-arginine translocation pathway signal sequence domain-containing protein [Jannaschia pagri]|uniref:Twin-arginine translocation pathway signal sequence domain-containing protein n=1 Tax=Jannaschia pagri TaxID=2829797 RepID=A0ABQ4NNK5_9RHOB|nr:MULTISPECIES: YSC84-related protein [unclassified Jannaschia]GIT92091.1 twin-arginine translocation pathway signal sequence domain-containing protein [Jannaschia sp. AI_61]GIT95926.1 twin-arginine translocation pathway signal sequence domain-containing protein [Jannaschia sp. AI_62]